MNSVWPEQRSVLENMSLSSRTVRRPVQEMSNDVQDLMKSIYSTFVAFSLALDESTDIKDIG